MGKEGKQQAAGTPASDVWNKIDSTVANLVGQRVFYNHPECGKSFSLVIGTFKPDDADYRNSNGQIQSRVEVHRCDGKGIEVILAPLSGDGAVGTFRLANDGDTRN